MAHLLFSFDLQAHVPFLYLFSMYKSKIIFTANPIGFLSLFQFPHHHIFLFYVHFPCDIMKCKEEPWKYVGRGKKKKKKIKRKEKTKKWMKNEKIHRKIVIWFLGDERNTIWCNGAMKNIHARRDAQHTHSRITTKMRQYACGLCNNKNNQLFRFSGCFVVFRSAKWFRQSLDASRRDSFASIKAHLFFLFSFPTHTGTFTFLLDFRSVFTFVFVGGLPPTAIFDIFQFDRITRCRESLLGFGWRFGRHFDRWRNSTAVIVVIGNDTCRSSNDYWSGGFGWHGRGNFPPHSRVAAQTWHAGTTSSHPEVRNGGYHFGCSVRVGCVVAVGRRWVVE